MVQFQITLPQPVGPKSPTTPQTRRRIKPLRHGRGHARNLVVAYLPSPPSPRHRPPKHLCKQLSEHYTLGGSRSTRVTRREVSENRGPETGYGYTDITLTPRDHYVRPKTPQDPPLYNILLLSHCPCDWVTTAWFNKRR